MQKAVPSPLEEVQDQQLNPALLLSLQLLVPFQDQNSLVDWLDGTGT